MFPTTSSDKDNFLKNQGDIIGKGSLGQFGTRIERQQEDTHYPPAFFKKTIRKYENERL